MGVCAMVSAGSWVRLCGFYFGISLTCLPRFTEPNCLVPYRSGFWLVQDENMGMVI